MFRMQLPHHVICRHCQLVPATLQRVTVAVNQLAAELHLVYICALGTACYANALDIVCAAANTVPCPRSSFEDRHSGAKKLVSLAPCQIGA